jgi:hypothetical protein
MREEIQTLPSANEPSRRLEASDVGAIRFLVGLHYVSGHKLSDLNGDVLASDTGGQYNPVPVISPSITSCQPITLLWLIPKERRNIPRSM